MGGCLLQIVAPDILDISRSVAIPSQPGITIPSPASLASPYSFPRTDPLTVTWTMGVTPAQFDFSSIGSNPPLVLPGDTVTYTFPGGYFLAGTAQDISLNAYATDTVLSGEGLEEGSIIRASSTAWFYISPYTP